MMDMSIIKVKTINKISSLNKFDGIIMMINHKSFKNLNLIKFIKKSKLKMILDNSNFFKDKKKLIPSKTSYIQTGQAGWLD